MDDANGARDVLEEVKRIHSLLRSGVITYDESLKLINEIRDRMSLPPLAEWNVLYDVP